MPVNQWDTLSIALLAKHLASLSQWRGFSITCLKVLPICTGQKFRYSLKHYANTKEIHCFDNEYKTENTLLFSIPIYSSAVGNSRIGEQTLILGTLVDLWLVVKSSCELFYMWVVCIFIKQWWHVKLRVSGAWRLSSVY